MLKIQDLTISVNNNKIVLEDINLEVNPGQLHVVMGPNGSGKSSLAYSLMGHPKFIINSGTIFFNNINILELPVEKRARTGLFLACQYPQEIPGVTVFTFLKEAHRVLTNQDLSISDFKKLLYQNLDLVNLDHSFAYRNLNENFSGGEKKRLEILQMLVLQPKLAILDEIDSGLDLDGIKLISKIINHARDINSSLSIILITHNPKILDYLNIDLINILYSGKLVKTGNKDIIKLIETSGYGNL